jgi:hypothetical protein
MTGVGIVSQKAQHLFGGLGLTELSACESPIVGILNQDVSQSRDQTMVNSPMAANVVLVRACVKKPEIQWLLRLERGQVNGVDVLLGVVVVVAITSQTSQKHPFIGVHPSVQRKHQKAMIHRP